MSFNSKKLPDGAPFGHEQKVALDALLPTLKPEQASWLAGYFAALAQIAGSAPAAAPLSSPLAPVAAQPVPTVPLTVLYGTESGNAEDCAQQLFELAKTEGFKARMIDMGDYNTVELEKEKNVLMVASTWGEGDPPERAVPFHEFLQGDQAPALEGVNFSVCALGDTSYADFCEFGKQLDRRFAQLGANRIADRVDCDVDYEDAFGEWMKKAMSRMVEVTGVRDTPTEPAVAVVDVTEPGAVVQPVQSGYGKKNPFSALLKQRILLNGRGSAKETIHVELSLEGSGITYQPGDVLGVFPTNCPEAVEAVASHAGFRGDEIIESGDGEVRSLLEVLERDHDVTNLSANFMKNYAPLVKSSVLNDLLKEENRDALSEYLAGRELRDLFGDFPPPEVLPMEQFLGLLRKIPPRLYSIASSLRAHPDEVHLTVGVVRFEAHGIQRKGVCSSFLADRVEVGETVPVFLHVNKNFHLPEDPDTPIIMVGPGTGIAPFRAFTEERKAVGAKGRSWLFFGEQRFNSDFLYQTEWQQYLKEGSLTRMDVAFSRDTPNKIYVQHRMRERAKDLYAWLEEGAYFYVCGDAGRMAKDVNDALIDIHMTQGDLSREDAEARVKRLQKDKRYQKDVY